MATFTKEEIAEMNVDMTFTWEPGKMIPITVGDGLYKRFAAWFGLPDDPEDISCGYINFDADISGQHALVYSIYAWLAGSYPDGRMDIDLTIDLALTDQRAIFNQLLKSGGESFKEFLLKTA